MSLSGGSFGSTLGTSVSSISSIYYSNSTLSREGSWIDSIFGFGLSQSTAIVHRLLIPTYRFGRPGSDYRIYIIAYDREKSRPLDLVGNNWGPILHLLILGLGM